MTRVVVCVGNLFRRDDGVGPAAADELARVVDDDVRVIVTDGEPSRLLDAWAGADLAVVVDAVLLRDPTPGRIHRTTLDALPDQPHSASSHGLGVPEAVRLGVALGRLPRHLVVYAVEAADVGFGTELSPAVAAAVPELVSAVAAELRDPRS